MPGVLMVEALAQTAGVAVMTLDEYRGKLGLFAGIYDCRFRRMVLPGDTLRLEVTVEKLRGMFGRARAVASVGGEVAVEATLSIIIPCARRSAEGRQVRDGERRVVITGMGALTPIGNDVPAFWDGLVNGRSGIGPITILTGNTASKVAGDIKGFDADSVMPKKEVRRNDRYVHSTWAAVAEAMRDAGLDNPIDDEDLAWRTGCIIGSGIGGINTMIRDVTEAALHGVERIGPFLGTALIPDMAAGYVAIYAERARAELRDGQRLFERESCHRRLDEHHPGPRRRHGRRWW